MFLRLARAERAERNSPQRPLENQQIDADTTHDETSEHYDFAQFGVDTLRLQSPDVFTMVDGAGCRQVPQELEDRRFRHVGYSDRRPDVNTHDQRRDNSDYLICT